MEHTMPTATIVAESSAGELVCAAAGRISTTQGTALEVLARSQEKENNATLIERVVASGHQSVLEHAMFTIAFDSVSVCVEEFVIEFRLASFTVQSRRYVDFTHVGCYTPPMPAELVAPYQAHMAELFGVYAKLLELSIPKEDARFVLPYSFRSNFYCTMNARELMHMISAMCWGRGSIYPELKMLGESLAAQFSQRFPHLLERQAEEAAPLAERYQLPSTPLRIFAPTVASAKVRLLSATSQPEEWMRHYACCGGTPVPDTQRALAEVFTDERPRELELVHVTFRIESLTLAAVTHLVRHRMQTVLVPQVLTAILYNSHVLPETIAVNEQARILYEAAYQRNTEGLQTLLDHGLPVEAVQYFALAGNQLSVICDMNARELQHFFALRTCNRAQWEIRAVAKDLLRQLRAQSPAFYHLMGPSCYVTGKCPEGRLSCGQAAAVQAEFAQ